MYRWFTKNFDVLDLILVAFCIVSYASTIYSIAYWTGWRDQGGAIGGVLDFSWFGQNTIYHVTKENLKDELLFSFPDITSYLLAVMIILNIVALFKLDRESFASMNLILTMLCMAAYVFVMTHIDIRLKFWRSIGGVVDYIFPLLIAVTHVYEGHIESSLNWRTPDYALYLLFLLLILDAIAICGRLNKKTVNSQSPS